MNAVSIEGPAAIARFRWVTIRGGLKLEARGMRRRGKSCRQIVLDASGLPRSSSYEELIAWCDQTIMEFEQ